MREELQRKYKLELVELEDPRDLKFFTKLMRRYHRMGYTSGFAKSRIFVLIKDGYWVAGASIQPPQAFITIFRRFNLDSKRSYFLRRIAKFCPGDHLVELLDLLSEKLKNEGKELLVTLGNPVGNSLYYKAKFRKVGYTVTRRPVFVRRLQE